MLYLHISTCFKRYINITVLHMQLYMYFIIFHALTFLQYLTVVCHWTFDNDIQYRM